MKLGSLFAGIGGFEEAFEKQGFKTIWANEIDKKAVITYKANFNNDIFNEDIKVFKNRTLETPDVITAGFPCQPFSVAGYRLGTKDHRGNLFYEILDIIKKIKPRFVLLENVKGLLSIEKGKTFESMLNLLNEKGYKVKYKVMNTYQYSNLPQNRERIYIVAFKNQKDYENFNFQEETKDLKKVGELVDYNDNSDEKYQYNEKYKVYELIKNYNFESSKVYQLRRTYIRENKKNLIPTLTANMGTGGHNVPLIKTNKGVIRKLTPRECFNIQGFRKEYKIPDLPDSAIYKQIGNSISVPVVEGIAKEIKRLIKKEE